MSETREIEEQLRAHAAWLATTRVDLDPATLQAQAVATADASPPLPLPPLRRRLAIAAAILLVLGAIAGYVRSRPAEIMVTTPGTIPAPTWTVLPELPIDPSLLLTSDVQPIWTGTEVLLVGMFGRTAKLSAAGAIPAFNPSTRTWRMIDPPPGNLLATDLGAAWTGTRLLLLGSPADANGREAHAIGASYDPATDRWTPTQAAPAGRGVGGTMAWTGDRMLGWAPGVGVTAYTPATDSWEVLTDEGGPVADPATTGPFINPSATMGGWTGTELLVPSEGTSTVAAFDPSTRSWRELPRLSTSARIHGRMVWTGRYVAVGESSLGWIEPHGLGWTAAPPMPPMSFAMSRGPGIWLGDRFLTWGLPAYPDGPQGRDAALLDLPTSTWRIVPAPPSADIAFSHGLLIGDEVFTWGRRTYGTDPSNHHDAIGASMISLASLTDPRTTRTTTPGDAAPEAPDGVDAAELAVASYGFSTVDATWQFTPYRPEDRFANVLSKTEAYAAAQRNAAAFVAGGTPVAEAKLGHLLQRVDDASTPKDRLAWKLSFQGIPGPSQIEGPICAPTEETCTPAPGSTAGSVTVVVDARTGEVLLLQHTSPGGG